MKNLPQLITRFSTKLKHGNRLPNPVKNTFCDEIELDKWVISNFILKKLVPVVGVIPFPLDELMLMTSTVCSFRPQYIYEWGTNIGKSARIFYEISKSFKTDSKIHSIDLPDHINHVEHPHSDRGKLVKHLQEVNLPQGDGITKSIELYKKHNTDQTVLFFLDGDHSYESVSNELHSISTNVRKVVILLHDTFYQSPASNYNVGPNQAINDFLTAYPNTYKQISTTMGLPGMTLLYKQKKYDHR